MCHDELQEGVESDVCPACGTVLHAECLGGLWRCPTLGCPLPFLPPDPPPRPARPRVVIRLPLPAPEARWRRLWEHQEQFVGLAVASVLVAWAVLVLWAPWSEPPVAPRHQKINYDITSPIK